MQTQNKSPALAGEPGFEKQTRANYTRRPKKWERVLRALLTGKSFNRFEAERELADHVLPSTVAGLQSKGLTIFRHDERIPGFQNIPTICSRYRLAPESYQKARELLQTAPRRGDHREGVGEHPK